MKNCLANAFCSISSASAPYCAVFVLDFTTEIYSHYDCLTDLERTLTILPSSESPASGSTTPPASAPSTSKNTTSSQSSNHSHAGAIGGGVVAGVIFIALVIGGVFLYLRKRKQRQVATQMSEVQT
jgi:hypothetical protein